MSPRSTGYTADDIQVLEGLEAVRKRPGMYIGSTDSRGLQHCMWEIVDNAVDEAMAGHCTKIVVTLHADRSVEISDNGRGIPVGINKQHGVSALELVFTKLHAGGKFGGSGYEVSGGLHGVGASVVNALSSRLDVAVDSGGTTYHMSFHRGDPGVFNDSGTFTKKSGVIKDTKAKPTATGTTVRYWADREIFLADADIDLALTYDRARQTAFLIPGLTIEVIDDRAGDAITESFRFDGGAVDFVEFLAPDPALAPPISIKGTGEFSETIPVIVEGQLISTEVERTLTVDIALRWGTGYDTHMRSFVNTIATSKGGTHVVGFERALTRAVVDAASELKALRANEENPIKDDVLEGLTSIVCVRLAEPQFEGQTKEILGTAAATKVVADVVGEVLKTYFAAKANKTIGRKIVDKVVAAARVRRELRSKKETARRKTALESSSMPAKLADCLTDDVERSELILVEGDSAAGSAKEARDSQIQAILPLRGKILNVQRALEKKMLDNAECGNIITAIGGGFGKSFNVAQVRYGKIIIMTDADVDGAHIRTLILTLFNRYMRPLLEAGMVYSAVPPLHRITLSGSGEYIYTFTDEEYQATTTDLEKAGKKIKDVQRYKGLGEMDADQLADTTLDIAKRTLRRITANEAEAEDAMFEMLMGQEVAPRRDYIVTNALSIPRERIDA